MSQLSDELHNLEQQVESLGEDAAQVLYQDAVNELNALKAKVDAHISENSVPQASEGTQAPEVPPATEPTEGSQNAV